mmetsp:Transcript_13368/g.28921  ORF Transcript_13368/g.28921 Transcript_13368/m.28921 type:complete len:475 (-) Transcript_13368:373-1797(-)|eukprot:CAMPEP_0172554668 /NCGR_PEP_ID=MMETSP1067-20121228/55801_1 /TAXON_ID=265564 ORGANISM="Thalassiosira punctigera, Strain Tpunct2005C2" /NCGR_SAMPLE_ID=MMETSP1067 /ASSEMBLY_ACC=CAM_ASM_000444 /LENGTH=474 /DNA_ID=CAMNT_0013343085 /DNA_START=155 /DNA_END=1579 /DNA_ORIENTATION=-
MDNNEFPNEPPRQRKKPKVKESIIDHTYRDYSQVEVSSDEEATAGGDDKKQSRLQPNFPAKLHAIVSNPNYQHIICWQPHGRSWKIVDKHLLSTVICPKHFAHAKFESFNRSVNGWGFKRLLNPGPDCKSYYHECFLRGRPELTKLMQRLVNPGKRLPDKAGEPDFYEISRKYPLPAAPSNTSQEQDIPSALSPHHAQRTTQPSRYSFPPSQAGGYPYGYYPAGPYPQLPSPASSYGQPYPPQPPQQAYWPNQIQPNLYPPNPSAYGYYPYPQMMMPQGYDPQSFQQPSMYSQYYPSTPTAGYPNPASPGRLKPPGQAQQQQIDEHGQYYQSPGTRPDRSSSVEADIADERKPPARTGVKRPLEETHETHPGSAGPAGVYPPRPNAPTHHLEGSNLPPHAAAARSAQEGTYNPAEYGGQRAAGNVPGAVAAAAAKPPSEGGNAAAEQGSRPVPKEEGGDGINEQQLLQDFFQHF